MRPPIADGQPEPDLLARGQAYPAPLLRDLINQSNAASPMGEGKRREQVTLPSPQAGRAWVMVPDADLQRAIGDRGGDMHLAAGMQHRIGDQLGEQQRSVRDQRVKLPSAKPVLQPMARLWHDMNRWFVVDGLQPAHSHPRSLARTATPRAAAGYYPSA